MLCHLHTANTKIYIIRNVCGTFVDIITFDGTEKPLLTHLARTFFLNALILKEANIVMSHFFYTHILRYFNEVLSLMYLRFPCDDLTANGCLHSDLKHLPWYGVFESLTHGFPCAVRRVSERKRTHTHRTKNSRETLQLLMW